MEQNRPELDAASAAQPGAEWNLISGVDSLTGRTKVPAMTLLQEVEEKAGRLPESERAVLVSKLLATLPPLLHEDDDGLAEAQRRDAELDASPDAGMTDAEFRAAIAAARRK
ncbi:MAG: hypothetical protein JNK23_07335 [Opitutaceae bacterium]|nr:hypothetical protein [Opitutaceae bacterium]